MKPTSKMRAAIALLSTALLLQGCVVGPKYHRATVTTPGTFKEVTPDDLKNMDGWKVAQPQDAALHGKWWEIFGDPQLNALEEQVNISNQNVAAAFANFMAALFGALPLALGTGPGSELRKPLGITIIGGLILSQMLTLYTTPVVYLSLDRMRVKWLRAHGKLEGPQHAESRA